MSPYYIPSHTTSIIQALDKMESEWEPIVMDIIAYKETGTFIQRTAEETAQLLDDHIVMTQAMSFSPYKKPFEGRITTWESKLRTTQVCASSSPVYQNMFTHTHRLKVPLHAIGFNGRVGCLSEKLVVPRTHFLERGHHEAAASRG